VIAITLIKIQNLVQCLALSTAFISIIVLTLIRAIKTDLGIYVSMQNITVIR